MAITDGLISCFECEEASGNLIDAVGGANTATDHNGITSAGGKVGNARQFTAASTQYASKASSTFPTGVGQSATVCSWCYLDTVSGGSTVWCAVSKLGTSGNYSWAGPYYLAGSTNRFQLYISSDGSGLSSINADAFGVASTGTWYFVVCRNDHANSLMKISVNAGTVNSAAYSGGIFAGSADLLISGTGATSIEYWNGRLDQILIYNRSISDAEIVTLYNSGSGLSYAAMTGATTFLNPFGGSLEIPFGGPLT